MRVRGGKERAQVRLGGKEAQRADFIGAKKPRTLRGFSYAFLLRE
jgi:hypothetical protein